MNAAVGVARAFLRGAGVLARDFERGYPYAGWAKAVYEINGFDAYSTEFVLASIFETAVAVRAWVRIDQSVPLRISYLVGAVQRV